MRALVERLAAALRLVRVPAILFVVYLILHALFAAVSEREGMITPEMSVRPVIAFLGISVLLLRLVVVFALPAVVTYRLAAHAVARALDRGAPGG